MTNWLIKFSDGELADPKVYSTQGEALKRARRIAEQEDMVVVLEHVSKPTKRASGKPAPKIGKSTPPKGKSQPRTKKFGLF